MEKYPPYQSIFAKLSYGESQMLDKAFYEEEVKRLCLSFEQQVIFFFQNFNLICTYKVYSLFDLYFLETKTVVPLWGVLCIHETEGAGD
jgi:hypothetical protein